MKALLILEDGAAWEGESLGVAGSASGEVVFNTGMTGYQEILTDPSYAGQIVVLTYPLIGNYGINDDDFESGSVQPQGLVVHSAADEPSNWRSTQSLDAFLKARGVVGIKNLDTRALTRALRARGVMMGAISINQTREQALERLRAAPQYASIDFVRRVSTPRPYNWYADSLGPEPETPSTGARGSGNWRIALMDCGVKYNILRGLAALGCDTRVFPCTACAEDVLRFDPHGIVLSPGPGDPARLGYVVDTVRDLIGKRPILGVCLGNQLLGSAFGAGTFKLKFGHRGSNHPVKDLATGRVYITSQNHGYALDPDGLRDGMEVAQVSLNDGTVEGLRHNDLPIFSIQYHPEASPGPRDSACFFRTFLDVVTTHYGVAA